MKICYIIKSIGHFSYHASIIKHLIKRGHDLHILFDEGWSEGFSGRAVNEFSQKYHLTYDWSLRRRDWWRMLIFNTREILSYNNYLNRTSQSEFYTKRWSRYLFRPLRTFTNVKFVRYILASETIKKWLLSIERKVPPDQQIVKWLRSNYPDVVIASPVNHRFDEEVEYIKAAKFLGIPTVLPVLSWDNLTTKGLIHVLPDLVLVWNQAHKEEAIAVHGIPSDKIKITGSPFFDKWFHIEEAEDERFQFCEKIGLDPDRPFALYLGSSRNIAKDETWLVKELVDKLRISTDPQLNQIQILVRPHPANAKIYKKYDNDLFFVWPKEGALPDTREYFHDFYYSLQFCETTIGINTSGMIDAIVSGKICISFMTEQYSLTQAQTIHFQHLLSAKALYLAHSSNECLEIIKRIINGEDSTKEYRKQFVKNYIRHDRLERDAGEVAACAIEELVQGDLSIESHKLNYIDV